MPMEGFRLGDPPNRLCQAGERGRAGEQGSPTEGKGRVGGRRLAARLCRPFSQGLPAWDTALLELCS